MSRDPDRSCIPPSVLTIPMFQLFYQSCLPQFHHSNLCYSNSILSTSPHLICHSRMLLSLDFPRDDEVLEPSGIQANFCWYLLEHSGVTTSG